MAKTKYPQLQFERKNKHLQKIPKDARVAKRPILHPPVASPYAGASVPKVVYISSKTPFMCAVKRVQRLLGHAEKRAASKVDLINNKIPEKAKLEQVVQAHEALKKEQVLIMATGRAIDKALSLERWFKERGEEYEVNVRTKAVLVMDDILPNSEGKESRTGNDGGQLCDQQGAKNDDKVLDDSSCQRLSSENGQPDRDPKPTRAKSKSMSRKQRAKERKLFKSDGLPTSRTRYVNGVEIAVSLK